MVSSSLTLVSRATRRLYMAPDLIMRCWKLRMNSVCITDYVKRCVLSFSSEKINLGVYGAFSCRNLY